MDGKDILNLGALNESSKGTGDTGGTNVTIPGGVKEQPTKDGIVMTSKEYDEMMKKYQASFKECCEFMGMLNNITISDTNSDAAQLENAIYDEIFNMYDSGPVFEAVNREDKKEVKKIVTSLRPKIEEFFKDNKYSFRKPAIVLRVVLAAVGTGAIPVIASSLAAVPGAVAAGAGVAAAIASNVAITAGKGLVDGGMAAVRTFWGERLWQIVGVVNIEDGNVRDVQKLLNEKFADELDGYKILFSSHAPTLIDAIVNKFGWKNKRATYFVLIDKKLPAELKQFNDAIKDGLEQDGESDENIKEGTEMELLYKEYLQSFVEYGTDGSPLTMEQFTEAVNSYNETGSVDEFAEGVAATYRKRIKQHNEEHKDNPGKQIKPLSNREIYNTVHTQRADLHAMHKAYNEARKARGEKPIGWTAFKGMKIAEIDIAFSGVNPVGESAVVDHLADFLDEHAE